MKTFAEFLKTTLAGGFLVLLPLFGCAFLVVRSVEALLGGIRPLLSFLPDLRLINMALVDMAAVCVLLLMCFFIGLLVRTARGKAFGQRVESRILYRLPGYTLFQNLSNIVFGREETSGVPVVVRQGDVRRVGFLVEEHVGGESTVFYPQSPTLLTGTVVIVRTERVEKLDISKSQVARSLTNFGLGMSELLPEQETPDAEMTGARSQ